MCLLHRAQCEHFVIEQSLNGSGQRRTYSHDGVLSERNNCDCFQLERWTITSQADEIAPGLGSDSRMTEKQTIAIDVLDHESSEILILA